MGARGGRRPAGGTCGRARVRVGPQQPGRNRRRDGDGDTGTGTATPAPPRPPAGRLGRAAPRDLNPGRVSSGGAPPAMEPPARPCSCGSSPGGPSDSEAEAGGPPKPERSRKRPGGPDPELPASPQGGKRPRKGDGGDAPPSDGDRLFAQKCQELRGFIRPLAELLEGLKRGRYERGLSSFQQSVAMDRIQRIIGVLQKPEMGARYLGTLLQVEGMLRVWFPHVTPKPAQDHPAPAAGAPQRRRPPAGPPGAPRCRRLPEDSTGTPGTSRRGCHRPAQTGTPLAPDA
ncbi:circadian-associated transcriptional repressor [Chlamydotis macqueenii]